MASSTTALPASPVPTQTESKVSTFDADPLLVVAYVIFAFGALLLFAAALRLGYWCIQRRSRKQELDWMLLNSSKEPGTKPYCGRGIKSRHNDYSNSDNNSLKLRIDDMFGKGGKQDIYAKVKKKKKSDSSHTSILNVDSDPNHRPEDFWHIGANEIPENEGSITNLTGSSMRLHRDVPLVKMLRDDERTSTSGYSDMANSDTGAVKDETERPNSVDEISDDVRETGRHQAMGERNVEDIDSILQDESRGSIISENDDTEFNQQDIEGSQQEIEDNRQDLEHIPTRQDFVVQNQESDTSDAEHEDTVKPLPGPVHMPGLKMSDGKVFMTLDDIRAESMNPGSFASLQASWKIREAQIQSGLNDAMLIPTVGLNYTDDEVSAAQGTSQPPVAREQIVLTQQYTNPDEERMFSFASSKGKLASVMESPKITRKTKHVEELDDSTAMKYGKGVGVAAVDQIYMDPQEITERKRDSNPVFTIPPPPPLPAEENESDNDDDKNDNQFSFGADNDSINSNSQTVLTSLTDTANSSVLYDKQNSHVSTENGNKSKHLRFNEEIEEIRRISVMDDVSEISSVSNFTYTNSAFTGIDDDEDDDDSMMINDDEDDDDDDYQETDGEDEDDDVDKGISSLRDRPPTPVPERKTTHM